MLHFENSCLGWATNEIHTHFLSLLSWKESLRYEFNASIRRMNTEKSFCQPFCCLTSDVFHSGSDSATYSSSTLTHCVCHKSREIFINRESSEICFKFYASLCCVNNSTEDNIRQKIAKEVLNAYRWLPFGL